jgi:16S rRNA (guanine527-N7)-methyltransferase
MTSIESDLIRVLDRSRALGFLGPGPVETQLAHALAHLGCVSQPPREFLDLGSGGGVPGLVAALHWSTTRGVLIDANERRCRFLLEAVAELGLVDRVTVVAGRAEELAHDPTLRARFPVVLSRSFGSPAVTAECGAGFLELGGALIVSEPPTTSSDRWPPGELRRLGLGPAHEMIVDGMHFAVMHLVEPVDARVPRRVGIPAKRPLW